jgi:hypothetical protein
MRPFISFDIFFVPYGIHRVGNSHEETDSARQLLARNLRLQSREDEAKDIERVRSWSKYMTSNSGGPAIKRNRDDSQ